MEQPPDIGETFVREVDENLRRDQLRDFFKTYGNWLIAGVILFLAASGGLIWWRQHQVQRSEAQVEEFAGVFKDIGSGNISAVPRKLDQLSDDGSKAVRASAMFARAALALQQGDTKTAIAKYKAAAADSGLPQPYRDAALIRQTALEFDQLQPQDVMAGALGMVHGRIYDRTRVVRQEAVSRALTCGGRRVVCRTAANLGCLR